MRKLLGLWIIIGLALSGCGSRYQAPIDQAGEPLFLNSGRQHLVNEGETIYAVAWMYDLDFAALARVNHLQAPYTLTPGQKLTVDLRGYNSAADTAVVASSRQQALAEGPAVTAQPVRGGLGGLRRTPLPENQSAAGPTSTPMATAGGAGGEVTKSAVMLPAPGAGSPAGAATTAVAGRSALSGTGEVSWTWPYRGQIVGRFSDSGNDNKGIDIAGKEGDPVLAAADGEVVYAGSGLLRYGNLLIIKHNDRFLSAYAHNRALLVTEKARVSKGQKIAELGSSGIDKNILHFEIRVDGKPVDPMIYLSAIK